MMCSIDASKVSKRVPTVIQTRPFFPPPQIKMGKSGLATRDYFKIPVEMQCMLHLVSERLEVSNHFNDLLAGLLVVFNDLIISKIKAYYVVLFQFPFAITVPVPVLEP